MRVGVIKVWALALPLFGCGVAAAQQPVGVYYGQSNVVYPSAPGGNQRPDRPLMRAVGAVAQAIEQNNQLNQIEQLRRQQYAQNELQRAAVQIRQMQMQNQWMAQQAVNQQIASQPFLAVQSAGYHKPAVQPMVQHVGQSIGQPVMNRNYQPGYRPGPQFTPDYRLAGNVIQAATGVDVNQKQREVKESWDNTRRALGGVPTPPVFREIGDLFGW